MVISQKATQPPKGISIGFALSDSLLKQLESSVAHLAWASREDLSHVEVSVDSLLSSHSNALQKTLHLLHKPQVHLHGSALSIASMDQPDSLYLKTLREMAQMTGAQTIGDFIGWTGVGGRHLHALMPAVFNSAMLLHLKNRIENVQQALGRPLVLENTLAPVAFKASEMSEPTFLNELSLRSGATFSLNLTTLYRNSLYQDFDPEAYLQEIQWASISNLKISMISQDQKKLCAPDATNFDGSLWSLLSLAIRLSTQSQSKVPPLTVRDEGAFDVAEIQKWVSSAQLFLEESARGAQRTPRVVATNSPS